MNETVIVALIVAVFAPILNEARKDRRDAKLAIKAEAQRQLERTEEREAREEVVAKAEAVVLQAEEAARLNEERQNQIAAQTAEAASLLLERQALTDQQSDVVAGQAAEAARLLLAFNEVFTESQIDLHHKLNGIQEGIAEVHTFVDGDMTAARQAELNMTRLVLTATKRILDMDREAGRLPSQSDIEAVAAAEDRIKELRVIMADRLAQQKIVEAQAAAAVVKAPQ